MRIPNDFFNALASKTATGTLNRRTDGKVREDACPPSELWDQIAYAAWACADPGVQYDTTINEWHTCPEDGRINASNPCVTGDTLVRHRRKAGAHRRRCWADRRVIVGSDGELHAIVTRVFPTGRKPVYRTPDRGSGTESKLTADHKVLTANRGDVPAADLTTDDRSCCGRPRRSAGEPLATRARRWASAWRSATAT